jgi:hypothetical protein
MALMKARVAAVQRKDRAKVQAAVKALLEAGQTGHIGNFLYELDQLRNTGGGWPLAMRQIARLGTVSKEIQSEFALMWVAGSHPPCDGLSRIP